MKLDLLNKFENYYNIIKNYDYINYHDDYYISYYFYLKQIKIIHIKLSLLDKIFCRSPLQNNHALNKLNNKYNRNNLNKKISNILTKLNIEGKFDDIKK